MTKSIKFAKAVLSAFEAAGNVTDADVGAAGGPSTTWMTNLRKAANGDLELRPRTDILKRIDAAANWPQGTARRFWLHDQEPVENPSAGYDKHVWAALEAYGARNDDLETIRDATARLLGQFGWSDLLVAMLSDAPAGLTISVNPPSEAVASTSAAQGGEEHDRSPSTISPIVQVAANKNADDEGEPTNQSNKP